MEPQNLRFGGGVSGTVLNPAIAVVLILTGLLICLLPRHKALVPFLCASFLIPADQILVFAGLHFPVLRILILFGMIRVIVVKLQGQARIFSGGLNNIDRSLILLSLTTAVAGILLFQDSQAFVYQLGELYTVFGTYFLLRCFIRDYDDAVRVLCVFAILAVVLGGVMIFEQIARWSPYALFGGARAGYFASDLARDGSVRATASFGTPILAGTFGAVLLPILIGLWLRERKRRGIAAAGILGAAVMVAASHSSTPALACLAGLFAVCLWPMRSLTRAMRWALVAMFITLQLVMKAPVYSLITRISISGDSYHRYALINETVRHFSQWWLIGTNANAGWGWHMWDTANQYVMQAIRGGLLGLILFIAVIIYSFKYLGTARRTATDHKQALFFWCLGSALFAYTISFFGISLWDQSLVEWYALLALIGAVAIPQKVQAEAPQFELVSDLTSSATENPVGMARWEQCPRSERRTHSPLPRDQRAL